MLKNNINKSQDDSIDLRELFFVIMESKKIIIYATAFIAILAVIYSLFLPNIYKSKALLAPQSSSNSILDGFPDSRSLAKISGINVPSSPDDRNYREAIEKLTSLSFFENHILTNIDLKDLMAVESWDPLTNSLLYDKNIFDANSNTWIRKYSYPQQQIPSAQESFEVFKEKHLSLSEDIDTGFITLSIKHQSPFVAKKWVELAVNEVNIFYRQKDKSEAVETANYLNDQIKATSLSEIQQVLAELLQQEIRKLSLIEANEFYVFSYIDPPAIMEEKSEPSRALICILSTILGAIFSILYVIARHYISNEKLH